MSTPFLRLEDLKFYMFFLFDFFLVGGEGGLQPSGELIFQGDCWFYCRPSDNFSRTIGQNV